MSTEYMGEAEELGAFEAWFHTIDMEDRPDWEDALSAWMARSHFDDREHE